MSALLLAQAVDLLRQAEWEYDAIWKVYDCRWCQVTKGRGDHGDDCAWKRFMSEYSALGVCGEVRADGQHCGLARGHDGQHCVTELRK